MKLRIINRLFAAELLAQSVAIYSVSAIMFSERSGLSTSQVGLLLSVFAVTTLIFEIPTGLLADKFSRKWALVLGRLLLAGSMAMWLFVPQFWGYAAGMALMGVAESTVSGALQAYLYESLGENKKLFNKYNARLWSVMMTGWMIGAGVASLFGRRYTVLLVFSIAAPLVSACIAWTLPTDAAEENKDTTSLRLFTGAARFIMSTKGLIYAFLSIVTMKGLVDGLIEYIPLYYKGAGATTRIVPVIFLIGNFFTIFLFWHADKLVHLLRKRELTTGLLFLLLLVFSRYMGTVAAIAGIFLYVRYVRILFVNLESEFQHMAVNKYRATLGSLYSMGARLLAAASFALIGYASKQTYLTPIIVFTIILYTLHRVLYVSSASYRTDPSQE